MEFNAIHMNRRGEMFVADEKYISNAPNHIIWYSRTYEDIVCDIPVCAQGWSRLADWDWTFLMNVTYDEWSLRSQKTLEFQGGEYITDLWIRVCHGVFKTAQHYQLEWSRWELVLKPLSRDKEIRVCDCMSNVRSKLRKRNLVLRHVTTEYDT